MPHTYCRICGVVYQTARDRAADDYATPSTPLPQVLIDNLQARRDWSFSHTRTHPKRLHDQLAASGLWALPEAVEKLVPLGIIPVSDLVVNSEAAHAGLQAKRAPQQDAVY